MRRLLKEMNDRHIAALSQANRKEEDILTCRQMLRTLHHFWSRAADMKPVLSVGLPAPPLDHAAAIGSDVAGEHATPRGLKGGPGPREPGRGSEAIGLRIPGGRRPPR